MKFNYTKLNNDKEFKAGVDLDIIWSYILVEKEDGNILVLYTTLDPVESYQTRPVYNSKGKINGYADKKITEHPAIEVFVQSEIDTFFEWWNKDVL